MQRLSHIERKTDARKKIMLGGLIVKAGLDYLHPENAFILYGMLLDCKEQLILNPKIIDKWKRKGKDLLLSKNKSRL
ncbi:MAG TPA: conjugal transfer protein TraD [Rickettsia endosymbiont of Omalisus fontisbellaquei]|nr:conjugal transfer protein TraD [Rickettsia endosymbiont of Omalisus fontisbellaquei]